MEKRKLIPTGIVLSCLLTSCTGTKTVLNYQHLTGTDLKNGQVYEAESKPFYLLIKFRIVVGIQNDSIHVAIFGGGNHHKGGTHFIRESEKISKVIHYFRGEVRESSDEYIASTKNTFVFKKKEQIYIRFKVMGYHEEYQTEMGMSEKPFSSAFIAYQEWMIDNKIPSDNQK